MIDYKKIYELTEGIEFASYEHMKFYCEKVIETKSESDTYRKAFFYTLGITTITRMQIDGLYDFQLNSPKLDGFGERWQTRSTLKLCRLAINLYNGFCQNGTSWEDTENDTDGNYTPYKLFSTPFAAYMIEAIKIRYPQCMIKVGGIISNA